MFLELLGKVLEVHCLEKGKQVILGRLGEEFPCMAAMLGGLEPLPAVAPSSEDGLHG